MKNLKGKYCLITGAAGGIGSALAKQLLHLECNLLLVDIDRKGLEKLKSDLTSINPNVELTTHLIDLSEDKEIESLIQSINHLDILFNNAGIAYGASFSAIDRKKIGKLININLLAAMKLTHGLLPVLSKNKEAHIVNIASGAGLLGPGGMVAYATSKHGLVGFTESLRVELKDSNIGVSVICPAFVKTSLIINSNERSSEQLEKLDKIIQEKGVTPEKVATKAISAIKRNKGRIVIGSMTKSALITRFFFPSLAEKLNYRNYQKMKKDGTINSTI